MIRSHQKLTLVIMLSMMANVAFAADGMIGRNLAGSATTFENILFDREAGGIQLQVPPREEVKIPFPVSLGFRDQQHAQLSLCIVAGVEASDLTLSVDTARTVPGYTVLAGAHDLGKQYLPLAAQTDCQQDNIQLSVVKTDASSNDPATLTLIVTAE